MEEVARSLGRPEEEAHAVIRLLPSAVKKAQAVLCRLTNAWHYDYGVPFDDLPNQTLVSGTPQLPQVKWLYLGIKGGGWDLVIHPWGGGDRRWGWSGLLHGVGFVRR